jgi:hypothetical protein
MSSYSKVNPKKQIVDTKETFCFKGLFGIIEAGDCTPQPTEIERTQIMKQKLITDITKEMNITFSNTFKSSTSNICDQTIVSVVNIKGGMFRNNKVVNIGNSANVTMDCLLEQTNAVDLQTNIASALEAAIEKKIEGEFLEKLKQNVETELGSSSSKSTIKSGSDNDITIEDKFKNTLTFLVESELTIDTIQEAKQDIVFGIHLEDVFFEDNEEVNIINSITTFLQSKIIASSINKVVATIVDTQSVQAQIESKIKQETDITQEVKNKGFGGLLESAGKMIGNIFGGLLTPLIIVIVIIIAIVVVFKFISSKEQKQQFSEKLQFSENLQFSPKPQ